MRRAPRAGSRLDLREATFLALCERRVARASVLGARYPESSEALDFYGAVATLQKKPNLSRRDIIALVLERGPEALGAQANALDESGFVRAVESYRSGDDRTSPASFFARVLLQRETYCTRPDVTPGLVHAHCPRCGSPPQVGVLVAEGDGTVPLLCCALCFEEWSARSGQCVGCGRDDDETSYWSAPELSHLRVQACERCGVYMHWVDRKSDPQSVADVDEIAALPLDVWAREKGYRKIVPNLVGI